MIALLNTPTLPYIHSRMCAAAMSSETLCLTWRKVSCDNSGNAELHMRVFRVDTRSERIQYKGSETDAPQSRP
jgi:hypothetical protein